MVSKRIAWGSAIITAAALAFTVHAVDASPNISKKVQKAFKGQILLTDLNGLPSAGATDKATIAKFKKAQVSELKRDSNSSSSPWTFHYTAFMKKKARSGTLSFDFHTDDKDHLYVANKRIVLSHHPSILSGKFELTEDDGLNPRRTYVLKLVGQVKGREYIYAKTKISLK